MSSERAPPLGDGGLPQQQQGREDALEHLFWSRKKGPVVPWRSIRIPRCKQPKMHSGSLQ